MVPVDEVQGKGGFLGSILGKNCMIERIPCVMVQSDSGEGCERERVEGGVVLWRYLALMSAQMGKCMCVDRVLVWFVIV